MTNANRFPTAFNVVFEPATGRLESLLAELRWRGDTVIAQDGGLVFAQGSARPAAWAQNTWLDPRVLSIDSIGDAARQLRAIQRNWWSRPTSTYRRAALIAQRMPHISASELKFPTPPPDASLGAWTLADRDTMIASPTTSSVFPGGCPRFIEDRYGPPNRAYLKLWEALTLARTWPKAGQTVLDLGASPGGWSWVVASLGAEVIAIDRASLNPSVAAQGRVSVARGDAFKLGVADVGTPDWVIADIVAYPDRMIDLAAYWARAAPTAALIMTIKFRRCADPEVLRSLQAIPGGRLMHLAANKNELTFFRLPHGGPAEAA